MFQVSSFFMNSNKFSIKQRIQSFTHALRGLVDLFKYEHNSRIHLVSAIITIIAGFLLKITSAEWLIIILIIGLVFITELINTAIERLADKVQPEFDPIIKKVKDYAAAAVLVASITALVVGSIIFIPKI